MNEVIPLHEWSNSITKKNVIVEFKPNQDITFFYIPVIYILIFKSFGSDRKGVGKASPQYQKDSMSFWYLEESFIL